MKKTDNYLEAPFNSAHPSSRCPNRTSKSGIKLRHIFRTTSRNLIRTGVFSTIMTCTACGGKVRGSEDYTVTAAFFSL